jgi:ribosomal protein S18 acetylase RimI-like enzyme
LEHAQTIPTQSERLSSTSTQHSERLQQRSARTWHRDDTADEHDVEHLIRQYRDSDLSVAQQLTQRAFPFFNRFSLKYDQNVLLLFNKGECRAMIKGKVVQSQNNLTDGQNKAVQSQNNLTEDHNKAVETQKNMAEGQDGTAEHRDKKTGIISWILVDPDEQQRGMGAHLLQPLLDEFERQQCSDIVACVHCTNTASSRGIAALGFKPISILDQWKLYRAFTFNLWKQAYHLTDIGHLLWRKDASRSPASRHEEHLSNGETPWAHFILNMMVVFFMLNIWSSSSWNECITASCMMVTGLSFSRYASAWWCGRTLNSWAYRGWESSHLPLGLLSLITGFWWPNHGLHTCSSTRTPSRKIITAQGKAAVLSSGLSLGFVLSLSSLGMNGAKLASQGIIFTMLLEHALCFFPFQGWIGSRLWSFKKNFYLTSVLLWLLAFIKMI